MMDLLNWHYVLLRCCVPLLCRCDLIRSTPTVTEDTNSPFTTKHDKSHQGCAAVGVNE